MNLNGYSVDVVREHNLKLIMHFLYEKPKSCKELSIITGLSETAVKKNIVQLLENNMVQVYEEEDTKVKQIGRQHIRYIVDKNYGNFMLLDLSYSYDDLFFTDILGNVLYHEKITISHDISVKEIENLVKHLKELIKERKYNIKEIAISVPGQINETTGKINYSSRFSVEAYPRFIEIFNDNFKNIDIYTKNDLRFSIYGDPSLDERSKNTIASYVFIGYGIVSGFVKDGKIIQGLNGISGEIGSSFVNDESSVHDECAISALMKKVNIIYPCSSIDELVELYNTKEDIKELVLSSALVMAFQLDAISNAFGSSEIVVLGPATLFGDEYKGVIQNVLNKNKSFPRKVDFVNADKFRLDGMLNVLKDKITNCIE